MLKFHKILRSIFVHIMRVPILVLFLSATVSSAPITPSTSVSPDAAEPLPQNGVRIHPAVQAGLLATLTTAGVAGISIGLAEYIASVSERWKRKHDKLNHRLEDSNFGRERRLADGAHKNTGLDIVLDLVDRYLEGENLKGESSQKNEASSTGATGGSDEIPSPELNHLSEEGLVETKAAVELPLPRLPGFPPISEQESRFHFWAKGSDNSDESRNSGPLSSQDSDSDDSENGGGCKPSSDSADSPSSGESEECVCELHHPEYHRPQPSSI